MRTSNREAYVDLPGLTEGPPCSEVGLWRPRNLVGGLICGSRTLPDLPLMGRRRRYSRTESDASRSFAARPDASSRLWKTATFAEATDPERGPLPPFRWVSITLKGTLLSLVLHFS